MPLLLARLSLDATEAVRWRFGARMSPRPCPPNLPHPLALRTLGPVLALGLTLGACHTPPGTPVDSVVVHWEHSGSKRPEVRSASARGGVSRHSQQVMLHADGADPVALTLDLQSTPLAITESGTTVTHSVPTDVRMRLLSNDGWMVDGECEGPHYQLPEAGRTPEAMLLNCTVRFEKDDAHDRLALVQFYGDGHVHASGALVVSSPS